MGNSLEILPEDPNWNYTDSPWDLFRDCQFWVSGADNASIYRGPCILSHMLGFVSAYIFPFVGLVGIISNIFVTYIFLFVFRKPSRQMIYLACVSTADVLTIMVFGWIWMFPAKGLPYVTGAHVYFFIFNVNNYICKIVRYLYSFSTCSSSCLFLLTALDRCLSIYFPFRFARISRRRAWKTAGVVILFSALIMMPFGILVEHRLSNGKIICLVYEEADAVQIFDFLFAYSSPIQMFLVIVFNVALFIRLRQSAKMRETISRSMGSRREIAASMMLIILSTIVVICAIPQSISYVVSTILSQILEGEADRMAVKMTYNISDLCWHLLFIQYASKWLIYMKRMKKFRQAALNLLHCQRPLGRNLAEVTSSSIRYFTRKARNPTSKIHLTQDIPKSSRGLCFPISKKGGVKEFWNVDTSRVMNNNITSSYGGNNETAEIRRYIYRGSMRHAASMSTISPRNIHADYHSQADAALPDTDRIVTKFLQSTDYEN